MGTGNPTYTGHGSDRGGGRRHFRGSLLPCVSTAETKRIESSHHKPQADITSMTTPRKVLEAPAPGVRTTAMDLRTPTSMYQ